ncbi:restriction endonuclease subunit S [Proteus mirabilis]|uniref:restriction endonuclease subunit S n=1 Tax=Proteus mirabilis TaxID=584 RepID=UPI0034D61AFC
MSNGISKTDLNLIPAGYKQTEVGVIPEDWKVKSIGEIASIFSGGTPNRKIPEYWDGDIPWVTTTLIDGTEIDSAREFITQRGLENSSTNWCKAGTILLAMYGQGKTRGKAAILSIDATINQACVAIELKDICSSHYILHILNSMYEEIRELSNSGSQENLSAGIIKSIQIPFPPKKEQITIANALSDVDLLISELKKLIAKKQAIKTATMQQLLTGHTRLPQFALREDGSKKGTKQSELGEIPEDWEVVLIGNECDILTGFPFPSGKYSDSGIRLLRGSNIKRSYTDWSAEITQYWPQFTSSIAQYKLKAGDIVISMDGSLVGRSFAQLRKSDLPALLLQRVARLRSETISQSFLKEWIFSKFFTEHCDSVKTVTAIPHISPQDIRNFKLTLPPSKTEQTAIATILSDMDEEIQSLKQRLSKIRQIKQGMMQELLTGKTRLVQPSPTDICHVD